MVRKEVVAAGVTDQRVCEAMRETPRHLFVPAASRNLAYHDMALPIGGGQTISPPFIVAMMTQALEPRPDDKVLEVGTGSGYQAAVLSPLVADVYSVEIVPSLGRSAQRVLQQLNYTNVHTKIGDGFQGWAEHAPFDKIIVTCSPEKIPPPLVAQLREGGMIVIPLGERYQQTLYRFRKVSGELKAEELEPTFFVPMTGRAEQLREDAEDSGVPKLVNGDFASTDDEGLPTGWYYVRQAKVVSDRDAAETSPFLQFSNATPGRGAQALQALGIDGRQVRELELAALVKCEAVRPGQTAKQVPCVAISFFDGQRAPIHTEFLGPWTGTAAWSSQKTKINVPARSRLAVLAVGMFGAVGELGVDELSVRAIEE